MLDDVVEVNPHNIHSVLRGRIVEHVFVGDVLRRLWQRNAMDVEVLRSEFDAGGYDLVLSRREITRHIQMKSVMIDGKASNTKVSLKLMEKPSGCVIWSVVDRHLDVVSYLWFGGKPGEPLPDISGYPIAKHTKGNSEGIKVERPNHRVVPRSKFERLPNLDVVLDRLFGLDGLANDRSVS